MTKKILAVSLALCVMLSASSAMAMHRRPMQHQMPPMPPHEAYGWDDYAPQDWEDWSHQLHECKRNFGPEFGHHEFRHHEFKGMFEPDMPKEIRAIAVEVAKLRIDLEEALYANPMEKEKAFEIHDKIMKLEQDIERWKFSKKVDRIEAFREQHEERKNRNPEDPKPEEASK